MRLSVLTDELEIVTANCIMQSNVSIAKLYVEYVECIEPFRIHRQKDRMTFFVHVNLH